MLEPGRAGQILKASYPDGGSDDPVSYFGQTGDAVEALKYAWLYWPRLIELHGAVFVALHGDDAAEIGVRLIATPGELRPELSPMSWKEVVDTYNVIEIAHLFRQWRGPVEFSDIVHRQLGSFLVCAWSSRLLDKFPERVFVVRMLEPGDWPELRIEIKQESPALDVPSGWNERRRVIEDLPTSDIGLCDAE